MPRHSYGTVAVVLTCTHSVVFRYAPPRVGESIYCQQCTDMRKVTGGTGDWRAICDNCTNLYVTRRSIISLRNNVMKHLHTNPEHTVKVWQIGAENVVRVALTPGQTLDGIDSPDTLNYGT